MDVTTPEYTANIYHPAIVKLQPKADKVEEKIYDLMIKGIWQ